MPFITERLDDVKEARPVAEGEYDLRITKAKEDTTKKGQPMIAVTVSIEGEPEAPKFQHWVLGWDDRLEDEEILRRKRDYKRFCAVFNLDESFEVDELVGEVGRCFLSQEEGDDQVVRNRMKLPKLKD